MEKNYQNDEFLRKRKERQRKLRKRRLKIFFAMFIIIALIVAVVLSVTVLFPIQNITSKGSKLYTQAQIVEACGINKGDNLFTVSEKTALKLLKTKLPYVETLKIERSLPDSINLVVSDAKEFACYKVKDKYYSVSKSGWVLKAYKKKPKNVITITSKNVKCKVGSAVEFEENSLHGEVQNIIDCLYKHKLSVDNIDVSDSVNLKALVDSRFIVNFGTSADLEYKVKHLNSMIKEIDKKETGRIDLSMWNSQNTQGTFVQGDIK